MGDQPGTQYYGQIAEFNIGASKKGGTHPTMQSSLI